MLRRRMTVAAVCCGKPQPSTTRSSRTPPTRVPPDAPRKLIDAATGRRGRLDVPVNNAGTTKQMPLAETTAYGIASLSGLSLTPPSLLAHAALPPTCARPRGRS